MSLSLSREDMAVRKWRKVAEGVCSLVRAGTEAEGNGSWTMARNEENPACEPCAFQSATHLVRTLTALQKPDATEARHIRFLPSVSTFAAEMIGAKTRKAEH